MDVPIEELRGKVANDFQLVIAAARRTRQLGEGAPKMVDVSCAKNTTIALWEIAKGKVRCKQVDGEADG